MIQAQNVVGELVTKVPQAIQKGKEEGQMKAQQQKSQTAEYAAQKAYEITHKASETTAKAQKTASELYQKIPQAIQKGKEEAKIKTEQQKPGMAEQVKRKAYEYKQKAYEKAGQLKQKMPIIGQKGKISAEAQKPGITEQARHKIHEVKEKTGKKIGEIKGKTGEKIEEIKGKAGEKVEEVKQKIGEKYMDLPMKHKEEGKITGESIKKGIIEEYPQMPIIERPMPRAAEVEREKILLETRPLLQPPTQEEIERAKQSAKDIKQKTLESAESLKSKTGKIIHETAHALKTGAEILKMEAEQKMKEKLIAERMEKDKEKMQVEHKPVIVVYNTVFEKITGPSAKAKEYETFEKKTKPIEKRLEGH